MISKKLLIFLTVLYSLFGLLTFIPPLFDKKAINIINNETFFIAPYCDTSLEGNSEILNFKQTDDSFKFSWKLREGYQFPFAGISIGTKTKKTFSLSGFDFIEIEFADTINSPIFLYIHYHIDSYSTITDPSTSCLRRALVIPNQKSPNIKIPLSKMTTPEWWYLHNPKIKKFRPNISKINAISIEDGEGNIYNKARSISIKRFNGGKYKYLISLQLFFYLLVIPLFYYLKRAIKIINQRLNPEKLYYVKNEITDTYTQDKLSLVKYINVNFNNPELTKKDIVKDLGLSSDKITFILKKSFKSNLRDYLNDVRLKNGIELLQDTNLSITEIAFEIGYKLPSSFNRIFKKRYSITPSEMRKNRKSS